MILARIVKRMSTLFFAKTFPALLSTLQVIVGIHIPLLWSGRDRHS